MLFKKYILLSTNQVKRIQITYEHYNKHINTKIRATLKFVYIKRRRTLQLRNCNNGKIKIVKNKDLENIRF